MRVLVTGAAGFIGQQVVRALSARDVLVVNGVERRIAAILATDVTVPGVAALKGLRRVHPFAGDLGSAEVLGRIVQDAPDLVIHLAAVVSGQAEAEFDLGMRVNLQGTIALIEACRRLPRPPVFVFSSSVAVFSCQANETIDETALPAPMSSYGTQKLMGELLVRDATRKGFVLGRSLRLPTISVRPGKPNKAASSFASGIIREPLAGQEALLPVGRDVRLHLASPGRALAYMQHGAGLPQRALGIDTTLTLPGISVSVGKMIDTLAELAGRDVASRIRPAKDPGIEAIVRSWPGAIRTERAEALGFVPDAGIEALIRAHISSIA